MHCTIIVQCTLYYNPGHDNHEHDADHDSDGPVYNVGHDYHGQDDQHDIDFVSNDDMP